MRGFYSVPRWLEWHPVRREPNTWTVLLFCLSEANWRDVVTTKWGAVKRGELITSVPKIEERTGLGRAAVRWALDSLRKCDFITLRTTSRYSRIALNFSTLYRDEEADYNLLDSQITTRSQPHLKT